MGEIVLILFDLHADAPFFGVVIVEAVAEVFAPTQACATVGDEKPVGRRGNGRNVFFFQESEGGEAVGVVDAIVWDVQPLPQGEGRQEPQFSSIGFSRFATGIEDVG